MTNEEFQKLVIEKLGALEDGQKSLESGQKSLESRQKSLESGQKEIKEEIKNIKTRQDEIYQVVTAIEHSNQVGRSELDSQNIRLAKVEGKFKKAGKVFIEDVEINKASNL